VEFWVWIERASWLAGLVALVIGVFFGLPQLRQIRNEQRRLVDEFSQRPEINVGFRPDRWPSDEGLRTTLALQAQQASDGPAFQTIYFAAVNAGGRSARDVVIHYDMPTFSDTTFAYTSSAGGSLSLDTEGPVGIRLTRRCDLMHPRENTVDWIKFRLPPGTPSFPISISMSMLDTTPRQSELKVDVL
jgi:hypothetical protein